MKISGILKSKLKMIRSELARSDLLDDSVSQNSADGRSHEQFTCPLHVGYKVEVLCPKENFHRPLLCIKCLIDPEIEKQLKGENLIALNDLIRRGITNNESNTHAQYAKEAMEKKYFDFTSRDYIGIYDRYVESQMKRLDREIERFKESLEELRFQINQVYEKQSKLLKAQDEELRKKVMDYIEEQVEIENLGKSTPEDIMEAIRRMDNIKEYERFMKALYYRSVSGEGAFESVVVNGISEMMKELKNKVNSMKGCKIDTSKIEGNVQLFIQGLICLVLIKPIELRSKLDSVEMLDQIIQAGPTILNPQLKKTLDKIRSAEKVKRNADSAQKETLEFGYNSVDKYLQRRAEFLGPLQERLSYSVKREENSDRKVREMEIEKTPSTAEYAIRNGKTNERISAYSPYDGQDRYIAGFVPTKKVHKEQTRTQKPRGVDSATQTSKTHSRRETTMDYEDNYYQRYEEESSRQLNPIFDAYESNDRRATRDFGNDIGDHVYPHTAEFPMDQEFTFHQTPEQLRRAKDRKTMNEQYSSMRAPQSKGTTSKIKGHTPFTPRILSHSVKTKDTRRDSHKVLTKPSKSDKLPSRNTGLDSWIKSENKTDQEKKKKEHSIVHNLDGEALFDSNEEDAIANKAHPLESDNSTPPTPKKSERGIQGLHDWINRRVTGYLIFQNTMHDEGLEKERDDDHLNRITGKMWKKLSKTEQEEYKSLALKTRVEFKKEFQDVDKDSPELPELQELIDQKLKKVVKEQ